MPGKQVSVGVSAVAIALVLVSGCGRFGFQYLGDAGGSGPASAGSPGAAGRSAIAGGAGAAAAAGMGGAGAFTGGQGGGAGGSTTGVTGGVTAGGVGGLAGAVANGGSAGALGGSAGNAGVPAGTGGVGGATGCTPSNGGVEVCDGLDNDCVGGIDDGVVCRTRCRGVADGGNGYMFCEDEVRWDEARAACEAAGMRLVKIDSAAENEFVGNTAFATGGAWLWLGGDDLATEASWHWADGSLFWTGGGTGTAPAGTYTNWFTGYPRAVGDCLEMRGDMTWNDKSCTQGKRFICELLP